MQAEISSIMHCWLIVRSFINGTPYILLRGVNWWQEFDTSRAHVGMGRTLFWHVPTVKFEFGSNIPSPDYTLDRVAALIKNDWPGLVHSPLQIIDQDLTGRLGRFTAARKAEPITRIFIDLGEYTSLPIIELLPNKILPWKRHPITWAAMSAIEQIALEDWPHSIHPDLCSTDGKTAYYVRSIHDSTIDRPQKMLLVQASIAEPLQKYKA